MRAASVLLLAWFFTGCERPTEPAPRVTPSVASVPSTANDTTPPPLVIVSELESGGLRVRSGTLTTRAGPPGSAPAPWGFSELELDPARTRLEVVVAPGGAPLEKLLPDGGLAIVNGGYFEADFRPSTWLVSGGVQLAKKSDTRKGGVLALSAARTFVGPMSGLDFEPSLALQSFPLVVESDGQRGIHRDDGRRAARTVACLVGSRLHLVVLSAPRGEGPTLFETADLLRARPPLGFGCRVALNLDGGPSSGVWFSPIVAARQRAPLAHVAYGLAVLPR